MPLVYDEQSDPSNRIVFSQASVGIRVVATRDIEFLVIG